ncbi:arsenate reductase family protein [Heyndrickxia ginsengihumi]|uniref:arsenate reductase family protein n=1 Tax=Heyndrickxia ginsengihumi TaxID=363870 RepID=UPI003D1ED85B
MEVTFYWYPKCGTCRKAKKWLEDHQVDVEAIHIVEHPPTKEQLKEYYQKSGLEIKKLFNTSGQKYRALGLKDKIQDASEEELLELLSSDGMLIKRPILISDQTVLFGFKEEQYENMLNKS